MEWDAPVRSVTLTGSSLTLDDLVAVARDGVQVGIDPAALAAMGQARAVVERAIAAGRPAYAVTTGVGSRKLFDVEASDHDRLLVRQHRISQGAPVAHEIVRATALRLANALARATTAARPELASHLVAALNDRNESVVKASTRALINIGRKSTPAIVSALPSSSGRPRKAMLRSLEDIEDTKAEDAILAVLDSEKDPVIQAAAARALSKCGTAKSYVPLERWLLEGDVGVRVECAWSLGILIAKPAEGALRKTLEHPDANVRQWSARALENITGERVMYRDANGKMVLPYNLYR